MTNLTHLVVISGSKAYRYEGKRRIEEADVDMAAEDITIQEFKAALEDFRRSGQTPPVIKPADIAFDRLATELVTKRPIEGMTSEELAKLFWAAGDDGLIEGHSIEDIHAELNRRGRGDLCTV